MMDQSDFSPKMFVLYLNMSELYVVEDLSKQKKHLRFSGNSEANALELPESLVTGRMCGSSIK